jgi:hypothetical protein
MPVQDVFLQFRMLKRSSAQDNTIPTTFDPSTVPLLSGSQSDSIPTKIIYTRKRKDLHIIFFPKQAVLANQG